MDKPTAENYYNFEERVQRLMNHKHFDRDAAEEIVTESIREKEGHPEFKPPQRVKVAATMPDEPTKPAAKKTEENGFLTTKDLAGKLGTTAVALRRKLREIPPYNDGVFTRYRWNGWNDPQLLKTIKELEKAPAEK